MDAGQQIASFTPLNQVFWSTAALFMNSLQNNVLDKITVFFFENSVVVY